MNAADVKPFVIAAARAQGLKLEADEIERVCEVFLRNARIAELVIELDLPETVEPAPVYLP